MYAATPRLLYITGEALSTVHSLYYQDVLYHHSEWPHVDLHQTTHTTSKTPSPPLFIVRLPQFFENEGCAIKLCRHFGSRFEHFELSCCSFSCFTESYDCCLVDAISALS